jgi:hypothetical protein
MKRVALALALLVGGCTSVPPQLDPWGYEFTLGSYTDSRPTDDMQLMAAVPFSPEQLLIGIRAAVAPSRWGRESGLLDVEISEYDATQSGTSFAMTVKGKLRGRDGYGRVLAVTPAECNVVLHGGVNELGTFGQQLAGLGDDQPGPNPLTKDGRTATMWQKVWTACGREMATTFGNALMAQRLQQPAQRREVFTH